jgi:hypothetical protein
LEIDLKAAYLTLLDYVNVGQQLIYTGKGLNFVKLMHKHKYEDFIWSEAGLWDQAPQVPRDGFERIVTDIFCKLEIANHSYQLYHIFGVRSYQQ